MFKKLISGIIFLFIVCLAGNVWAANNVEVSPDGRTIEISSIDSAWVSSTDTTNLSVEQNTYGLYVFSIEFRPAATDDECIIYSGSSTSGVMSFIPLCADKYDHRIKTYPPNIRRHLYLDYTNGTYTAGSVIIIELWKYGN